MKKVFWALFTGFCFVFFLINSQFSLFTLAQTEEKKQFVEEIADSESADADIADSKNVESERYNYGLEGLLDPNAQNLAEMRPQPRRRQIVLTKRDKELIAIDPGEKKKYSGFLGESETGIVRLHDAANCKVNGKLINASEPCPWNVTGKATLFSFRTEEYQSQLFSDVQYEGKSLKIIGLNLLGFLTDLGDASIENLNIQSKGIKEMAEFQPSTDLELIKRQFQFAQNGFQINDFTYKNALEIKPDKNYALRLIAYDSKVYWKIGRRKINILAQDKRKDVVVVIRSIKEKEDGSIILLWKKLQIKDAPKLEFKE